MAIESQIHSKAATEEYRMNYEAIFGKPYKEDAVNFSTTKPVEYYSEQDYIVVGERAHVKIITHRYWTIPSNCWVDTSTVLAYDKESGTFETRNTLYKPCLTQAD